MLVEFYNTLFLQTTKICDGKHFDLLISNIKSKDPPKMFKFSKSNHFIWENAFDQCSGKKLFQDKQLDILMRPYHNDACLIQKVCYKL